MLSNKNIERVKIKMVKENLNNSKLARIIRCSNASLSIMFNKEKTLSNVENRLIQWLNGQEITFERLKNH